MEKPREELIVASLDGEVEFPIKIVTFHIRATELSDNFETVRVPVFRSDFVYMKDVTNP